MLKVYCYSKCSTCKKALNWLDENNVKYEAVDIKTEHPNSETFRRYFAMSGLPLKRFFNTSGMRFDDGRFNIRLLQERPQPVDHQHSPLVDEQNFSCHINTSQNL